MKTANVISKRQINNNCVRQKTENHIKMIFRLIMTTVYLMGIIYQNHSLFYRAHFSSLCGFILRNSGVLPLGILRLVSSVLYLQHAWIYHHPLFSLVS